MKRGLRPVLGSRRQYHPASAAGVYHHARREKEGNWTKFFRRPSSGEGLMEERRREELQPPRANKSSREI